MCGLTGIINKNGITELDKISIRNMAEEIGYRGPDDRQIITGENFAFGFNRLSINDLSEGIQPFVNEDKSIYVMVNGEIYNHVELRKLLKQKHYFKSKSDCEIVVHLYEEMGIKFLDYLIGMYSISIYDKRSNMLFLAKDRFGIKPLFYHYKDSQLMFSSEIKGLLNHPLCTNEFDWETALSDPWMAGLPTMNNNNPPSFFKNISNLPAGSILTFNMLNNDLNVQPYWDISKIEKSYEKTDSLVDQYIHLLEESVSNCMMSDVDIGVFLSGGIDSVITAAFAAKFQKIESFSVLSASTLSNKDAKFAHLSADFLELNNHQVLYNNLKTSPNEWKNLLWLCENPMTGPEQLYKYNLHRYVKQVNLNIKVILTGQGSDEFNGGYTSLFTENNDWNEVLQGLIETSRERFLTNKNPIFGVWNNMFGQSPFKNNFFDVSDLHSDEYLSFAYMKYKDIQTYNCWMEDRIASGNNIENRVPFLDHRLVELSLSIPREHYKNLIMDKQILRMGINKKTNLPPQFINRPKVPFYYGNNVNKTHQMMLNIMKQNDYELISDAFNESNIINESSFINILKTIEKDLDFENIEFATRLMNIGLLDKMSKDLSVKVDHFSKVPILPRVVIKDWDKEEKGVKSIFEEKNKDGYITLADNVKLLTPISSEKYPTVDIYIIVDETLEFIVDKNINSDWYDFLMAIKGGGYISEIIKEKHIKKNNIKYLLEDMIRAQIIILKQPSHYSK